MKKLIYVSYIKIWAMILVVFYHCLCGYSNIWGENYSWQIIPLWSNISHILVYFHMPIFTLMSAYLYGYLDSLQKYKESKDFVFKKIKRLIIPYIIWGLILCLIQNNDLEYILFGISHLWYLIFLFEAFMAFYFINKIPSKSKYILLIILYLTCFIINKINPTPFLGLGYFVRYMPYFVIGYYLYFVASKINIKWQYISIITITSFLTLILEYKLHNNKFILASLSIVIIICIIILCKQNEKLLNPKRRFLRLDKYLMGIYLIHHLIIQEMNFSFLGRLYMKYYVVYPLLQFVICFSISLVMTYLLLKSKIGKIMLGV